ncbi:exodeoxyribonuclease VII small subunit [Ectothiorhodospiraceae bacterium 2226]|nr:exodeoxyribonuclease VII small subunit [Ectothiorhodospiraceae bacterium 2226]
MEQDPSVPKRTSQADTPAAQQSIAQFEQALQELDALVARMEQGEQTLEEALRDFERGVELTRLCQQALGEAEQKVELLLQRQGEATLAPFQAPAQPEE